MADRLLLHACCGPCSLFVWQLLLKEFETVTPFFYNPNIEPPAEYDLRLETMKKTSQLVGYPFIQEQSGHLEWLNAIAPFADEPEGGARCQACIRHRLERTFRGALEHGFQAITTTLTVSRHKNTAMINKIGIELSNKYGTPYLERDFKKMGGSVIANRLAREANLYRQTYCGCLFSIRQKPS
jgi:predicted adenine nucleotide alpha hydrolase (AANH) superfamily ATPase